MALPRSQKEKWRLLALDVGLDTRPRSRASSSPQPSLWQPAFEYRRISERQLEKHDALRRAGRPRGRPALDPDVADRLIARRAEGLSYPALAAELNTAGVATAQGGAAWYPASVRSAVLTREREQQAA